MPNPPVKVGPAARRRRAVRGHDGSALAERPRRAGGRVADLDAAPRRGGRARGRRAARPSRVGARRAERGGRRPAAPAASRGSRSPTDAASPRRCTSECRTARARSGSSVWSVSADHSRIARSRRRIASVASPALREPSAAAKACSSAPPRPSSGERSGAPAPGPSTAASGAGGAGIAARARRRAPPPAPRRALPARRHRASSASGTRAPAGNCRQRRAAAR